MRFNELCSRSGCAPATVKYYLREGLLHHGATISAREADYDESHVERLRLIRALREIGDLPIAAVRDVVTAIETPRLDVHDVLGRAVHALGPPPVDAVGGSEAERREVLAYLEEIQWIVSPDAPAIDLLASILARVRVYWGDVGPHIFDRYRVAIDALAAGDLEVIGDIDDMDSTIRRMVVGTVLWDGAIIALRRLAAENHSRRRYSGSSDAPSSADSSSATRALPG